MIRYDRTEEEEGTSVIYRIVCIAALSSDLICIFYLMLQGCFCCGETSLRLPKNYKALTCLKIIIICSVFLASFAKHQKMQIIQLSQSISIPGILFYSISLFIFLMYIGVSTDLSMDDVNFMKSIRKFYIFFFLVQGAIYFFTVVITAGRMINNGLSVHVFTFQEYYFAYFSILLLIPYALCSLESICWLMEVSKPTRINVNQFNASSERYYLRSQANHYSANYYITNHYSSLNDNIINIMEAPYPWSKGNYDEHFV